MPVITTLRVYPDSIRTLNPQGLVIPHSARLPHKIRLGGQALRIIPNQFRLRDKPKSPLWLNLIQTLSNELYRKRQRFTP
ncbi:MAG: hypothetical protein KJ666_01905 [Bacteroidetes bacterium]|nr:hypothetical protein [Bacteroidota bacterium]MBU2585101.1 hypothetical protein [Bacteroidota bacterium]